MDLLQLLARLGEALESAGVPYFIGGSMASSLQGEPRATNDVDIVVDLLPDQVPALVVALGADFDVDAESLAEEARRRGSWNIFFLPLATKVDLFILKPGPFDQEEFARRAPVEIVEGKRVYIKSPEDTVLRKLRWYREGGETSERQWRDVVEVLRVNRGRLDEAYLKHWAAELVVEDLLARALAAAFVGA